MTATAVNVYAVRPGDKIRNSGKLLTIRTVDPCPTSPESVHINGSMCFDSRFATLIRVTEG